MFQSFVENVLFLRHTFLRCVWLPTAAIFTVVWEVVQAMKMEITFLRNVGLQPKHCKTEQPRRPEVYTVLTWLRKPKILHTTGLFKRSKHFQKFILQKLLTLNPYPVYGWKVNLSKFRYRWSEATHHWGCGCCYLWNAATSVGIAVLSIWHLPRHTWGSHRVLVRCENNFEGSLFSLYIAHRHMFNSTCKINFWICIFLFE
jgi:hypothetical protein